MSEISFNSIPVPFYVPGQYAEFDNSRANGDSLAVVEPKILLIGQKLAGAAQLDRAVEVFNPDQVASLVGRGSMLHQMAKKSFDNAEFVRTYILPLADAVGATKSAIAVTFGGVATAAGQLALYVGDSRYGVGVAAAQTPANLATAVAAAVNADEDRYLDAVVDGVNPAKVDFTARNAGVAAGHVEITLNHYADEALPAGITAVVGALTEGTVNPSLTTAIANLGDDWYPSFVCPYTDSTSLAALKAEQLSRFGPIRHIDAYAFACVNTDAAALAALPATQNSPLLSICDAWNSVTPPFALAAAIAGQDAAEYDPGRPRQTLPLVGCLARATGRRSIAERNTLIAAGISTLTVDGDGTLRIERLTTTYRSNVYGVGDKSYFDTESLHLLMNIRYSWRAWFAQKYPRHKLGDDGSTGANVMTPSLAKAESVAVYRQWQDLGWVEGGAAFDQFVRDLRAERPSDDPNRLNMLVPPDLINQLRVLAADFRFIR